MKVKTMVLIYPIYVIMACVMTWSCSSSTSLLAQDTTDVKEDFILWKTDVQQITKDKLDQLYTIDINDEISKYDTNGQLKYKYNNRRLGSAGQLDVTNPLQILVYYPDFQIIKTLDNNLAETGSFDLTQLDLTDVEAIATSNDGRVWIYSEVDSKLLKADRTGMIILEGDRMDLLFFGSTIHPTQIIERDNLVFVFDPEKGMFVFDNFGQFAYRIDRMIGGHIQFHQNQLLHIADGRVDIWNMDLRIKKTMATNPIYKDADRVLFFLNKTVMQIGENVYIWDTK